MERSRDTSPGAGAPLPPPGSPTDSEQVGALHPPRPFPTSPPAPDEPVRPDSSQERRTGFVLLLVAAVTTPPAFLFWKIMEGAAAWCRDDNPQATDCDGAGLGLLAAMLTVPIISLALGGLVLLIRAEHLHRRR